jgi:hypothetical protein
MNLGFNEFWTTSFYHGKLEDGEILGNLANEFFSIPSFNENYSEKNVESDE